MTSRIASEEDGLQFGTLWNGPSAVAHVPNSEFHDCNLNTLTFT